MLLLPISNFLWQKWAESLKTFSSASSCLKTFRQLYRRRSSTFEGGSSRVLFGNHMVPENPIKSHFVMKQISTTVNSIILKLLIYTLLYISYTISKRWMKNWRYFLFAYFFFRSVQRPSFLVIQKSYNCMDIAFFKGLIYVIRLS